MSAANTVLSVGATISTDSAGLDPSGVQQDFESRLEVDGIRQGCAGLLGDSDTPSISARAAAQYTQSYIGINYTQQHADCHAGNN